MRQIGQLFTSKLESQPLKVDIECVNMT